jgi:hypothetical protein
MAALTHLPSTTLPAYLTTECGATVPSVIADGGNATCPACQAVHARLEVP